MKWKSMIYIVGVVLMMSFTTAHFRDVTCGPGNSYCQEEELQDEFNEVDHIVDDVEDDVDDLEDRVDDTENDIDNLDIKQGKIIVHVKEAEQDIDDLEAKDKQLSKKIKKVKKQSETGDQEINDYLDSRSPSWDNDKVGGGGTTISRVKMYLFREFIPFLKTIFTTHDESDELWDKVYELEARNSLCGCDLYTPEQLVEETLRFKAIGTNEKQCNDVLCCYPEGVCLT